MGCLVSCDTELESTVWEALQSTLTNQFSDTFPLMPLSSADFQRSASATSFWKAKGNET